MAREPVATCPRNETAAQATSTGSARARRRLGSDCASSRSRPRSPGTPGTDLGRDRKTLVASRRQYEQHRARAVGLVYEQPVDEEAVEVHVKPEAGLKPCFGGCR